MSFAATRSPRFYAALVTALLFAAMLPASSVGQSETTAPAERGEASVASDMVFAAGEEVIASQKTTDDLFIAGGEIEARGARADHLFLIGGEIRVSDAQAEDVIATGGEIRLDKATVADDLIAAGGEVIARRDFIIGGTAVVSGGKVTFEAPVGEDLRIGASEIFVNSTVPGTARLSGKTIELGPNARIEGDLLYRGDSLTVDPAAVIEGQRTRLPVAEGYDAGEIGAGFGSFILYFGLSMLVSYFVIVALLVIFVPGMMRATSEMLRSKPLQALGIGVLYALIVPVLGIILLWTVVGIPLAVLLFVVSLALTPIAVAVTAHFIGMAMRRLVTKEAAPPESATQRILWPLGGVVALFALALIPLVGLLVLLLAMLFGLGAFARQAVRALSTPASATANA